MERVMKEIVIVGLMILMIALSACGKTNNEGTSGVAYPSTSGTAGTSGTDGVSGTNGINGSPGANGTNGTNGTNGSNGTNGTNGSNGANGTTPVIPKSNLDLFVIALYQGILQRSPDQLGLNYWEARYLSGEMGSYSIAKSMILAQEAQSIRQAALTGGTSERKIWLSRLYAAILNRGIDSAGEQYWLNQLASGFPLAGVEESLLLSDEFRNRIGQYGMRF